MNRNRRGQEYGKKTKAKNCYPNWKSHFASAKSQKAKVAIASYIHPDSSLSILILEEALIFYGEKHGTQMFIM